MARKQYPLRIDQEVWAAVEQWAADDMRSANAQVEWILRQALRQSGRLPKDMREGDDQKSSPSTASSNE